MIPVGCVERCPGCRHRSLSQTESIAQKRHWLTHALAPWQTKIASLEGVPEEERLHYRRRICLHARFDENHWKFGLLERKKNYRDEEALVAIPDCPVQAPEVNALLAKVSRTLGTRAHIPLRYVVVNLNFLTLVLKTRDLTPDQWAEWRTFAQEIRRDQNVTGVFLNLHPSCGRRVFDRKGWHCLAGTEFDVDEKGCSYGPAGFRQLLPSLYEKALGRAADFFRAGPAALPVLDLYSGSGTSIATWLPHQSRVLGVDQSPELVEAAVRNFGGAGDRVTFLQGKCADRIPQWHRWLGEHDFFFYANPPRNGLETQVLNWLVLPTTQARLKKGAYLSCSARSLARDLSFLCGAGYSVREIIPYDFFPQTEHVETLVLFDSLA